jgi:hypothetical protein
VEIAAKLDVTEELLGPANFFFVIFIVNVDVNHRRILEKALKAGLAEREHLDSKGALFQVDRGGFDALGLELKLDDG